MTEDERDLLVEARDSLAAARTLLASGFPGYAASRAYYSMFYVAEAFLETEELAFSKHSAVIPLSDSTLHEQSWFPLSTTSF